MSDYLKQLVAYACQSTYENLPQDVVKRAKEVFADTLAVIAAGAQEEEVKKLTQSVLDPKGSKISAIIGHGGRTEPLKAGLINGTAGTFLELDEGNQFARGHPGVHVFPAILAIAEDRHLSGKDVLNALVLGYEIGARLGIACKIRMSMHPHGTWGTVGAAVAVARLLDYDESAMTEMINVSSSLTLATSRRTMLEGGLVRNAYSGISGFMGILAHQLVDSGFTGERDGLSTVYGSVVSETFDPEEMTMELGERYEILRNYFKRHACCRYNHATLDGLLEIMSKAPEGLIGPENVTSVEVHTYSLAAQLCDQHPQNTLAGKFSIPFAIATTIAHGHAGVACFTPDAIQDEPTRNLAKKVKVIEDPELTNMMPDKRPSRVKVILSDGQSLEAETFVNKGDFEDPYSPEDLREKYDELSVPIWGQAPAEKIYEGINTLETFNDMTRFTQLFAPLEANS